jgi:hypothetical protein
VCGSEQLQEWKEVISSLAACSFELMISFEFDDPCLPPVHLS